MEYVETKNNRNKWGKKKQRKKICCPNRNQSGKRKNKEKQICCRNRNQCGEAENNVLQPQKKCASVFFPPLPEIYVSTPKTGNIFQ